MSIEFKLDSREFSEALKQYAQVSKKDEETIVKDRAGKVAFELFKAFRKLAPTKATLDALPKRFNYRIKRKFKGATVAQEIRRRINARFSAAGGWLPAISRLSKRSTNLNKRNLKGRVEFNFSEPSVTIINDMKEGVAAEEKHKVMQAAIDAQTEDMKAYINRKLSERAAQFSAK